MQQREVEIVNKLGLHARAAAKLVALASEFDAEVRISRQGQTVNGKSIMGVMLLAASRGTRIGLEVEGSDEGVAMQRLCDLIANRFGEDE